jgi:hypothetical protein
MRNWRDTDPDLGVPLIVVERTAPSRSCRHRVVIPSSFKRSTPKVSSIAGLHECRNAPSASRFDFESERQSYWTSDRRGAVERSRVHADIPEENLGLCQENLSRLPIYPKRPGRSYKIGAECSLRPCSTPARRIARRSKCVLTRDRLHFRMKVPGTLRFGGEDPERSRLQTGRPERQA